MLNLISDSPAETEALGRYLGQALQPGTVIALNGTLGTGKTQLTQGIALGLGIPAGQVVSPTFTLCVPHNGRLPLWHLDAYRIQFPTEVDELGLDEAVEEGAILVVEWAERIENLLPPIDITGTLESLGDQQRQIRWNSHSPQGEQLLATLASVVQDPGNRPRQP